MVPRETLKLSNQNDMLDVELNKATKADLEAELELFREIEGIEVAPTADLTNNEKRSAEVERLQKEHGIPVRLSQEFADANPDLAKVLIDNGAQIGDIVFAEEADVETAKEMETKRLAALETGNKEGDENAPTKPIARKAPEPEDLVYLGKSTVIKVVDAIAHGRSYKDVYTAHGESYRLTHEEFERDVTPRQN